MSSENKMDAGEKINEELRIPLNPERESPEGEEVEQDEGEVHGGNLSSLEEVDEDEEEEAPHGGNLSSPEEIDEDEEEEAPHGGNLSGLEEEDEDEGEDVGASANLNRELEMYMQMKKNLEERLKVLERVRDPGATRVINLEEEVKIFKEENNQMMYRLLRDLHEKIEEEKQLEEELQQLDAQHGRLNSD